MKLSLAEKKGRVNPFHRGGIIPPRAGFPPPLVGFLGWVGCGATPLPRVTDKQSLLSPFSDRLALAPIDQSSYYLFTEPIQAVHGLTIAFYTPGEPVKFPPDVLCVKCFGKQASANDFSDVGSDDASSSSAGTRTSSSSAASG